MPNQQKLTPSKAERDAAIRAQQEAEALRDNLKRRKAQSRARETKKPGKDSE